MGNYANCWLGNLLITSTKGDIDVDLISLFRPQDKVVISTWSNDIPSHFQEYYDSFEEDDEFKIVYYETPISIIRDRLELFGYNLENSQMAFKINLVQRCKSLQEQIEMAPQEKLKEYRIKELDILRTLSPELWIENIKKIHTSRFEQITDQKQSNYYHYMASNSWFGCPGHDLFVLLRLAIEAFDDTYKLIYDLTDLISAEYFRYDDKFVDYGLESKYSTKTIILTEGKTDTWILKESLDLLYPHLKNYFSFLDFEVANLGGGVGNLATIVKAFVGAGIINNIVALFDNDTAAVAACKALKKINIPPNIAVRHLPPLELLKEYPTIGPSGLVNLDINGIAASIELYLGEDVLRINPEEFMPIQWTGYEKSVGKYQGEVLDKESLQKKFQEKLELARNDNIIGDWHGIREVLKVLFTAFLDKNRATIYAIANEYDGYF